ncbi:ImmA/IrrE family metallo-endopeptidase [Gordonia sp. FQ]|uniref:ImmA/IrrE family metallo-endopeptidase n=1 Tax=Gordonia sp. FQ TaxID=3446634 RepID=UPI003F8345FC
MIDWEACASVTRAEEVARALLQTCSEFDLNALRTDPVETLAESDQLDLVFEDDLPADQCGGGYYRLQPPTIHLHVAMGRRNNFTVLHELGHHLQLQHADWAYVLMDLPTEQRRCVEEAVSNQVAVQVLMPLTDDDHDEVALHPADFMAGYYGRVNASRSATLQRAKDMLRSRSSRWLLAVADIEGEVITSDTTYEDAPPPKGLRQEGFRRVASEAWERPVRGAFTEGVEYMTGGVLDDMHLEAAMDFSAQYVFVALRPTAINRLGTMTYPDHECFDESCGEVFQPLQSEGRCDKCASFRCPACENCSCAAVARSTTTCDKCWMAYSKAEMQSGIHECW